MAVNNPARLREAVEVVLAARSAPPPPTFRAVIVPVLTSALIGPAARDEYVAALHDARRRMGVSPSDKPAVSVPQVALLRDGPDALTDELLIAAATSADSIHALTDLVTVGMAEGTVGPVWWEAAGAFDEPLPDGYLGPEAVARNRERLASLTSGGHPQPLAEPDSTSVVGRVRSRWARQGGLGLALAASLLLAFYLGTFWPRSDGRHEVRLASVAVRGDVTRGIDDVALDVANGTDRRVFLTVVGLAPGRKIPAYHYRSEGRYIEVPAGGTAAVKNLPPEFEGSTVLLVVSTHGPAGGVVREVMPPAVAPGSAAADAEQLRKTLADLDIDADVRVVALPAKR